MAHFTNEKSIGWTRDISPQKRLQLLILHFHAEAKHKLHTQYDQVPFIYSQQCGGIEIFFKGVADVSQATLQVGLIEIEMKRATFKSYSLSLTQLYTTYTWLLHCFPCQWKLPMCFEKQNKNIHMESIRGCHSTAEAIPFSQESPQGLLSVAICGGQRRNSQRI